MFSAAAVDPGTLELLRAMPPPPPAATSSISAAATGRSPCTLAHRAPHAVVWAVDVNERALDLTARNADRPGSARASGRCDRTTCRRRSALPGIWSNPPIRIGKAALHELLAIWLPRLEPGGEAWLVVHSHLGGDSLAAWLGARVGRSTGLASKRGYRILEVRHR